MTISLLGAGLMVLAGCQKEPFEEPEEKTAEQDEWFLTLEASKGADTKALNLETDGSTLTLLYPRATWDYTGQDGSAPSASGTLATKYDYALADVTVSAVDGGAKTITTDKANFANQQSIYRFKFSSSGTPLSVKQFTVSSSANKLVRSRSYDGSAWTSNFGSVSVVSDAATYTGTKDIPFTAVSAAGHAITVADVAVSKVSLLSKTGAIALKGDIW